MSLTDRILALAQLTLRNPRAAARVLLAQDVPVPARTGGLLLAAVVSAFLTSIDVGLSTEAFDPISAFLLASPILAAVFQWFFLALTVVLIHNVGRAFGGKGSFPDALLVVVWLQLLLLALQLVQILAFFLSPPLAGIIGLAGFVAFLWLISSFIAELHGFSSVWKVLAGIVCASFGLAVVMVILFSLILGPEAFQGV